MTRLVDQKKEDVVEAKRTRVPVHASRNALDVPGLDRENFAYRFADESMPYKLQRYLEAGYVYVDQKGKTIVGDRSVDSTSGIGSAHRKTGKDGVTLVLLAIPIDLYNEDQEAKLAHLDELEADQYRTIQAQADPSRGNFGHVGAFGNVGVSPMAPKIRKI